ncbi:hypothetical protein Tco_1540301 [Tanacetum coccineum]
MRSNTLSTLGEGSLIATRRGGHSIEDPSCDVLESWSFHEVLNLDFVHGLEAATVRKTCSIEFKRLSLTGSRSCTSVLVLPEVSKQTTTIPPVLLVLGTEYTLTLPLHILPEK